MSSFESVPDISHMITAPIYKQALESAGFVLCGIDKADNICFLNETIFGLSGYSSSQFLGQSYTQLTGQNSLDLNEMLHQKAPFKLSIITKTGQKKWVEVTPLQIDDETNNNIRYMLLKDITQNHQENLELQEQATRYHEAEELYRTLARNLPRMGIILFDRDLRFIVVEGPAMVEQGFTNEAMQGKTLYEVVPEERAKLLEQLYKDVLKGRETLLESSMNNHFYSSYMVPVKDTNGDIYAGLIVVRDITREKRIENELRGNEQRFRGLFENNNDAVFFIGLDGNITDVNPKALEILGGYLREEQLGKSASYNIAPSDKRSSGEIQERIMRGETIPFYERTFRRKNGTEFAGEINIALVYDGDGNPSHIQSIVRDISDRKSFEEELAERVQQLTLLREIDAELADRLNVDYVLTMALDSTLRLTGADSGFIALLDAGGKIEVAKLMGDYPNSALQEANHYTYKGILGRVIASQKPEIIYDVSTDVDYIAVRETTLSQMTVPLISQERLIGVLNLEASKYDQFNKNSFELVQLIATRIAVALDNAYLYAQSQSQLEQLQELYAKVSDLEQIKTDMIRIASHDLRNPLSGITGFIELIRMDIEESITSGELTDYLFNMESAARNMEKIINDILSLERIDQRLQNIKQNIFDFSILVQDVFSQHEGHTILKSHTMTLFISPSDMIMVRGDEAQLREAVANLIGNAIKYTPVNGNIDVRLEQTLSEIVFEVSDNGIGVPEELQKSLFQPFFRAASEETQDIQGTGLGLHLVKKIIERHSGKIRFTSVYGQGSTFGFTLPIPND